MLEKKKYNNFSAKLKEFLPKLKPNERVRFQLNIVHFDAITHALVCPQSVKVQPTDRIYDPWAKNLGKGEYEGDYVDIAYITRERPAPADSPRDGVVEFGKLRFQKTQAGIIEIVGGNREMEKALPLLFFNNRNSTNEDKPWFVKPVGQSSWHEIEKKKDDAKSLKTELKIDQAKTLITEMTDEEVDAAAAGLMPNQYNSMTPEGKVLGLRKIANTNPNKIIDLSKNVEVRTTAFIEECLTAGIIEMDKAKGLFVWGDDKTKICSIKAGGTPHNSLKRYFMTDEGVEVLDSLEKQLALSKKSKKEKTEKAVV